ncbi:MAG TPA: hypothetical protein VFI31_18775 [Pirellulales bacterium]|nr:hypothetical protein [Pirellulales bacterium]
MSEVRLVLRDAVRDVSGTCHGATADRVIAALSAEPETIEELDRALERFCQRSDGRGFLPWFAAHINDEPHDAGLMIVDLAARLIACESSYSSPGAYGSVQYHDGRCATQLDVDYHLPDDWTILRDVSGWRTRAEELRRRRLSQPPLDPRAVLYGRPLLEFIAAACFEQFREAPSGAVDAADAGPADEPFDEDRYRDPDYDAIRAIHASWLMTARDDLRGESPREVLFAKQHFLSLDMQDRQNQWSFQGRCPPTLDVDSHAYRFAGIGTHEWVNYYYLLRHLLWSCHDQVRLQAAETAGWSMFSPGDFLATEVPRLEGEREEWLDAPNRDLSGRTPRAVNDDERRRRPQVVSGHEAIIDDDCPLCQMMADQFGPMFWHLDGCNMDDEFAFSYLRTREEWEAQQREFEEMSRHFDAKHETEKELALENPDGGFEHADSVWQRSFSLRESGDEPLELRLFAVGSQLAEIIADLKRPPEDRPLIEALKRDFANLRDVARSGDLSLAAALIEPVVERFCETLSEAAAAHGELERRTAALDSRLRRFAEPTRETDDDDSDAFGGDKSFDDDDIPF